jgi:small-conductance mechanosensitive channel/CRP-like cAMP-binding protein
MHADFAAITVLIANPLTLAGVFLVAGVVLTRIACRDNPVAHFLCQFASFAGFTAMLSVAAVSPFKPTPVMDLTITTVTVSVFKMVWWLAASWLLAGLMRAALVFRRQPKETRFLQDLCAGAIYVCAGLGIVADVFDVPLNGLLAASGLIAIVLGLALQSTLGDVFSGVVLNLEKPYRPGDWITLEGGMAGCVIETNWRATHLLTLANDLAVIPNSVISKARLVNTSTPRRAHGITVTIRLDPTVAPLAAVLVLETALLSCTRILRVPRAIVSVRSLDAVALECELMVFIERIEDSPEAQNEVFDRLYRHALSAGIRLAPPSDSALILPPRGQPLQPAEVPMRLLERLPIFLPLSSDERLLLAPKMRRRTFKPGDILIDQGIVATTLFILVSGVLAAFQHHDAADAEILRYAPGDCFGQASLLTGATTVFKVRALTRAVVYEIARDDLAPILKARPAIAAELGQIMAIREAAGKDRLSELDGIDLHGEHLANRLGERVRALFGLGP